METFLRWFFQPVDDRNKAVLWIQSKRSKVLDIVASTASALSDEEFYVSILVLLHWAISSELALHTAILMSSGFVFGNMLKNLFCIPRPPANIVRRVRAHDGDDYSMPSTHSLQAISLPLWITVYLIMDFKYRSPLFLMTWIPGAICWAMTLSWSRLYLGAHTVQDVVGGWIVGFIISTIYCFIYPHMEPLVMSGDTRAAGWIVAFASVCIYLHPIEIFVHSKMCSFSIIVSQSGYLTSCVLAGVIAGTAIGSTTMPSDITVTLFQSPLTFLIRLLVGGPITALVYLSCKAVLKSILLTGYNIIGLPVFDPPSKPSQVPANFVLKNGDTVISETLSVHHFSNGAPILPGWTQTRFGLLLFGSGFQIMPVVKFIQYSALTWMVTAGCPLVFKAIGL